MSSMTLIDKKSRGEGRDSHDGTRVGVLLFSMDTISPSESVFVRDGIEENVRNDGRARLDYRPFALEVGVLPQASGSARLSLEKTQVLVGVSVCVGEPLPNAPRCGRVVCAVKGSPNLEGQASRKRDVLLSGALQQTMGDSGAIDLEALCLIAGKKCWVIYIDALVLDSDGNVLDAVALAANAALRNTAIPAVCVVRSDDGDQGTLQEIKLSDDPFECVPLNCANVPVSVSLTKIGTCIVVDATAEEEQCAAVCLTFAVDPRGRLCSISKSGPGGLSLSSTLSMMHHAQAIGRSLHNKLATLVRHGGHDDNGGEHGDDGNNLAGDTATQGTYSSLP